MTTFIGQCTTHLWQDRNDGPTSFGFFGEGYQPGTGDPYWATYASVDAIIRTALDDSGHLWIGFDYLHLYCPRLVGTEFPILYACKNEQFEYDVEDKTQYSEFINSGYYWGIVIYHSNPSYPSGDELDWYLDSNYTSTALELNSDITPVNMYDAGALDAVTFYTQTETPDGLKTEGFTYLAGTYAPDTTVVDPHWAVAVKVQFEGIEAWLDYYPWAIRKTASGTASWQSCNRSGGHLKIRKSGNWRDCKNQTDTGSSNNTVHHLVSGSWVRCDKIGQNG